ncbi:uncharacterized protein LOC129570005 [Sitodiplosis mosellana]|uniref:uncharacterized protein LOC129570005 n=1 Tax=Sitodiplosis mosellana TaxID=263140 RepID=UPI0024437FDE|nr:uncharacterized protein LOC129570005 [Sitodiplosis mosellana]
MTNPVFGLCPCCENPNNSVFMQSIHSDSLFKMLLKRGQFKRNYLFCNKCIDWAKDEVRKRLPQNSQYSPISEKCASRNTPDPFMNDLMMGADSNVGQRLANPTDSPLHLGNPMSPVNYMPYHDERLTEPMLLSLNRTAHLIAPLPSPLNDVANPWEMNDDHKSDDNTDHINL